MISLTFLPPSRSLPAFLSGLSVRRFPQQARICHDLSAVAELRFLPSFLPSSRTPISDGVHL